ncbi:MAG: FKBP-type peptidyl-prolyl cis-trans isomerase SlyD [Myxococcota bacterium]|jgi:FKBP-type peptidyl-prolyl cis-trans isomerase SlyD
MNIAKDSAVQIHYHLTDAEGAVIDSSKGSDPLAYLHGHGNLVPGVENALIGKAIGDKMTVVVTPEEGYGVRDPGLDVQIPLAAFGEHASELAPGAMFAGPHPEDETKQVQYTVMEVLPEAVNASGNHSLAGVTLHFDLEVMEIRAATAEELQHGHIHGPGGHHH